MLATEYADYYKIEAQRDGESDMAFRERVAGVLRDKGHIIEAHEAYQDERYESSDNVMAGVMGAVAQAFQGVDYGSRGNRQIGDDIAAGIITQHPEEKLDPMTAMMMVALFGGRR